MAKAKKVVKKVAKKAVVKKVVAKKKVVQRQRRGEDAAPAQQELFQPDPTALPTSTLKPGFLIGLKTAVKGNVTYEKETLEEEHVLRNGAEKVKWATERTIADPEEHRAANQVRMKARLLIVNECANTGLGLLCPESNMQRLQLATKEAKRIIKEFNATSTLSKVSFGVVAGRVARDDVEATRAIKNEVRELIDAMAAGVKNLEPDTIRKAANQARNIVDMLNPTAAVSLKGVVDVSRSVARKITKAGEAAAQTVDREAIKQIAQARTAFLEIEDEPINLEEAEAEARAIEMEPVERYRPEPEEA